MNDYDILSRDGKYTGKATGGNTRRCPMECCKGERIGVRWEDGKLTYPCTAAMKWNGKHKCWQLI